MIDLVFHQSRVLVQKANNIRVLTEKMEVKDDIDDAFRRLLVICYIEELNQKAELIYTKHLKGINEIEKYFADSRKYYNEHKSYIDVLLFLFGKETYLTTIKAKNEALLTVMKNLKSLRDSFAHFRTPPSSSAAYSLDVIIKQDYISQTEKFLEEVVKLTI